MVVGLTNLAGQLIHAFIHSGRPMGTTLLAKFRVPISTYISFKVHDFLDLKEVREVWIRLTLSASTLAESSVILINSRQVQGP